MVSQIKAKVASLEGTTPEAQAMFLAGTPPEEECGEEALTTLEVDSHM